MADLDKIVLRRSVLTGRIMMARTGRDPNVALTKRDATNDVFQALVAFAFDGKVPAPGARKSIAFGAGNEQFVLAIVRKPLGESP